MDREIFQNTVKLYPSYTKKELLKQATNEEYIINTKKHSAQLALNLTNCLDVSDDDTLDKKFNHMINDENILAMIEEYEYKKPYRYFCYFNYKVSDLDKKIKELVNNKQVNITRGANN